MSTLNRRTFTQLTAGALLAAASRRRLPALEAPAISAHSGDIHIEGGNYVWDYTFQDDFFRIGDKAGRVIVSGKMQPAIVVSPINEPEQRKCSAGKALPPRVESGKVVFAYEGVNDGSRVSFSWRFDDRAVWTDAIAYESAGGEDVVSLHYFCQVDQTKARPTLFSHFFVVPGICEGDSISPIVQNYVNLDQDIWLGRGSTTQGMNQQWALPVDYFCGLNPRSPGTHSHLQERGEREHTAFTCGLASLPAGDLFLQLSQGRAGIKIDYRGDLWKHLRGPGKLELGAKLAWGFGPSYYESIASYYEELLRAGVIHAKQNSARKNAAALAPQFCTWGAQVARNKGGSNLDEAFLRELYAELKASGMKAELFSIDDKWEGTYGSLVHSPTKFPHFEEFLAGLRADGLKVGIWAALMRCERPADFGLTEANMLQKPDGTPFSVGEGDNRYYIFDFTQPEVEKVLYEAVRKFIRRYKPDLFKFDFGYELPALNLAAPRDRRWAGELLMWKGLEIVIRAMREVNPDQVVMYYSLSPLFLEFFDLHSLDDLYLNSGEFDVEANRRLFFSSLLGRLGVPTYGSSGYDWSSMPSIWFDSAASGTIGTLNDPVGDEKYEKYTSGQIAKYNGVAKTLRQTNVFEVLPIGDVSYAPTRGAHAQSWARFEKGELVLLAYRPPAVGEEDALQSASMDRRVRGVVEAAFPVIVSSKTDRDITRSSELALAPYGAGTIALRREAGRHAEIRSHYFGDSAAGSAQTVAIENGRLMIKAEARNAAGKLLEWIEVKVAS